VGTPIIPADTGREGSTVPSISVHVDAPEGLPPHSVTVIYKPATADEFERIVEAAGGPLAFRTRSATSLTRISTAA
jgi:hypothetical protein